MKFASLFQPSFGAVAAAAMLASCSGASEPQLSDPGRTQPLRRLGAAVTLHPGKRPSWMAAEAKKADLLYIVDVVAEDVDVFTYPAGKLVGTLTGFDEPNSACSDKSGDVFIVNTYALDIIEYAHGSAKPKAILKGDPEYPNDCSVDPTTGDLAVTNTNTQGSIAIFKHARGKPEFLEGGLILYQTYFCGYDNLGNLFIDGFNNYGDFQLAELPKGKLTFSGITVNSGTKLNFKIGWPGGVQWDAGSLALGDQYANKFIKEPYANVVYKLKISGNSGTVMATVPLVGGGDVVQFWVQGTNIIGPDAQNEYVGYWKDRAGGGSPTKVLTKFYVPVGATVSEAGSND